MHKEQVTPVTCTKYLLQYLQAFLMAVLQVILLIISIKEYFSSSCMYIRSFWIMEGKINSNDMQII